MREKGQLVNTMRFIGPAFVLDVPTDWFVLSAPGYQTTLLSPKTSEDWRASFVITHYALEDNDVTPAEFLTTTMQAIQSVQAAENAPLTFDEPQPIAFGDVEGAKSVVQTVDSQSGEQVTQQIAVAFYEDMAYIFNASRPATGAPELLEKVDAIFEAMFGSLRFQEARLEA